MGVSVREKIKGSGEYWLFIRHAGERVCQVVGDRETADDAAKDIRRDIRTGRFAITAMKAARATEIKKEPAPDIPTLKEFFEGTVSPLWESSLAAATFARYETSWRCHILPAIGDVPLHEITRDRVKKFVSSLMNKPAVKRTHGEEAQAEEAERVAGSVVGEIGDATAAWPAA